MRRILSKIADSGGASEARFLEDLALRTKVSMVRRAAGAEPHESPPAGRGELGPDEAQGESWGAKKRVLKFIGINEIQPATPRGLKFTSKSNSGLLN